MDGKEIQVGILGCGGFSKVHAREYLKHQAVKIVALCDVSEDQVESYYKELLADTTHEPKRFTDPVTMYESVQLDAVSIITPHTLHYQHCVQALEAGCHVLVEKPMVTCLEHAQTLHELVKNSGKILCVGYNTPSTIEFQKLKSIIANKELGPLKVVALQISQPWLGATRETWRQNPKLSGGGMIYDSGAHVLNSLVWTVGSAVDQVHAWIDQCDSPVDINGTVNVRFQDGVMATIAISGESPSGAWGCWMFEGGKIELNPWGSGEIKITASDGSMRGRLITSPQMEGEDQSPMHHFIDAILGMVKPRTTSQYGIYQSQLMDAIYASAKSGQVVRVQDM